MDDFADGAIGSSCVHLCRKANSSCSVLSCPIRRAIDGAAHTAAVYYCTYLLLITAAYIVNEPFVVEIASAHLDDNDIRRRFK